MNRTYELLRATALQYGQARFRARKSGGRTYGLDLGGANGDLTDLWIWSERADASGSLPLHARLDLNDPADIEVLAAYTILDPDEPQAEHPQRRVSRAAQTVVERPDGSLAATLPDGTELIARPNQIKTGPDTYDDGPPAWWIEPDGHHCATKKGARKHLARRAAGLR